MFLGIEIGGTKLQLGVGAATGGALATLVRRDVERATGADGILRVVEEVGRDLIERHDIDAIGIGFGGPVSRSGRVIKSHHVAGWDNFDLAGWCTEKFRIGSVIANDADTAALAEARFGAGQGADPVAYVTVGTGIGGGFVRRGAIYRGNGVGASELGHLRPGPTAFTAANHVEWWSAGWGIAARAQARVTDALGFSRKTPRQEGLPLRWDDENPPDTSEDANELMARCESDLNSLTATHIAEAAAEGNRLAADVFGDARRVLGWALAQMVTLMSPEVIVVGGGVSLADSAVFFNPLVDEVERYVFPALRGSYRMERAALGEEVVVHGAIALAADRN